MIIGSEPVSMAAIDAFTDAFSAYGLAPTAIKPSYGIAEATLFIANIPPDAVARASYFDGDLLSAGQAVAVSADAPNAVAHVSCGVVARSLRAIVVDPDTGDELPDGSVGEFWLHGDNVGRGYWDRPEQTRLIFGAQLTSRLPAGSRAEGVAAAADLAAHRRPGHVRRRRVVRHRPDRGPAAPCDGRAFYPQEIEATVADARRPGAPRLCGRGQCPGRARAAALTRGSSW